MQYISIPATEVTEINKTNVIENTNLTVNSPETLSQLECLCVADYKGCCFENEILPSYTISINVIQNYVDDLYKQMTDIFYSSQDTTFRSGGNSMRMVEKICRYLRIDVTNINDGDVEMIESNSIKQILELENKIKKAFTQKKLLLTRLYVVLVYVMIHEEYESTQGKQLQKKITLIYDAVCQLTFGVLYIINAMNISITGKCIQIPNIEHLQTSRMNLTEDSTPVQILITYTLNIIKKKGLRRCGSRCYRQVDYKGQKTHAWEDYCNIETLVYNVCQKSTHPQQWTKLVFAQEISSKVSHHLQESCEHEFPDLVLNRNYISFRNGVYCTPKNKFYEYGDTTLSENNIVAMNFIDADFDVDNVHKNWQSIETPLIDNIFNVQNCNEDTIIWAYIMMGRLLYEVGEKDNWQVGMFIKGTAGSGKSTIANILKCIFPSAYVGTLSSNSEQKFGLSGLYDKMLYVCSEVKRNFCLDQGDWQSMISGEEVSVAKKFQTAQTIKWKVPGLLCGNELPKWVDASGSIIRRIVLFNFDKRVRQVDTKLFDKLKSTLGNFICKINKAYLESVVNYGNDSIWKPGILSDQLLEYHHRLKCDMDNLYAFLTSKNYIEFSDDSYIEEGDFTDAYRRFGNEYNLFSRVEWCEEKYRNAFEETGVYMESAVSKEYPHGSGEFVFANYVVGIALVQQQPNN